MAWMVGWRGNVVAATALLALPLACGEAFRGTETNAAASTSSSQASSSSGSGGAGGAGGQGTSSGTGGVGGNSLLADGQPCEKADQCQSGRCPQDDGVCCNQACVQTCRSCIGEKTGGQDGICANITEGTDPDDECTGDRCTESGLELDVCDGGTQCQIEDDDCDGYHCTSGPPLGCRMSCSIDNHCADSHFCAAPNCIPKANLGEPCSENNECLNNFCVLDVPSGVGICCNTACEGLCHTCNGNYTAVSTGICSEVLAGYDPNMDCNGTCDGTGMCN